LTMRSTDSRVRTVSVVWILWLAMLGIAAIVFELTRGLPEWQTRIVEKLKAAKPSYSWNYTWGGFGRPQIDELTLYNGSVVSAANLAMLEQLGGLRQLTIYTIPVSDDILKEVCRLKNLERLTLNTRKPITDMNVLEMMEADKEDPRDAYKDSSLAELANLRHLRFLELRGVLITDEQVKYFTELEHLESLSLFNARLSFRGIRALKSLHNLELLAIGTIEDEETVKKELREEHPECKIFVHHWPPDPGVEVQ
jgi:hypothetical protein